MGEEFHQYDKHQFASQIFSIIQDFPVKYNELKIGCVQLVVYGKSSCNLLQNGV